MNRNKLFRNRKKYIITTGLIIISFIIIKYIYGYLHATPKDSPWITLYLSQENKTIKLPLEDYVTGTVAAEMPASFGIEALKAQAVCARTYSVKKILEKHLYPQEADLSDDINSCQAYISFEEFQQRNPTNYQVLWEKIRKAVDDTRGIIAEYDNNPIDALYHSTCGGKTENARDVWGQDVPYLKSVECDYCQGSRYYNNVEVFSYSDLNKLLDNNSHLDIKITEKTSSGRIRKLVINDKLMSGERFRKLLNLPSNWFKLQTEGNKLIVNSRGYGHGLGLCQYGANGMAKNKKNYQEILHKYYTGIDLCRMNY